MNRNRRVTKEQCEIGENLLSPRYGNALQLVQKEDGQLTQGQQNVSSARPWN